VTDENRHPLWLQEAGRLHCCRSGVRDRVPQVLHARFPFPDIEHCRVAIDYTQKLIEAMNAQGGGVPGAV
jgi:hypothetical protein